MEANHLKLNTALHLGQFLEILFKSFGTQLPNDDILHYCKHNGFDTTIGTVAYFKSSFNKCNSCNKAKYDYAKS